MPSVRVRRGSQYASLLGEDEQTGQDASPVTNRPRSRTLASIYHDADPLTVVDTGEAQGSSSAAPYSENMGQGNDNLNAPRTMSKVASSILLRQKSAEPLRNYRSQDFGYADRRRPSRGSDSRLDNGTTTFEGRQADVVVPNDGRPGLLESHLSISSADDDPFDNNSSQVSLNHEDDIVEHLDAIDPQVATVSNLANAANAILIPPIGYSRKPVIFLPRVPISEDNRERQSMHEDDLDRHVEEVLSRRAKIRRTLQGVWAFIKTPMGVITAIYGFCVVFWGAAIVLFLLKWINLHNALTQGFWVEVSSQIECALFTVTGVGLIPWRVMDTYRIIRIWHYKNLTQKLRDRAGLPVLYDEDDLPDPMYDPNYVHVLSERQERQLHRNQKQFMKSQTWYRPHGTPTHRAFPIDTALLICILNDGNSVFQCILCGCMWGLNRFNRPAWTTGTLIPASFLCGIFSAVFIWRGSQKTRRTKEVEERLRLALTLEKHPDKFHAVDTTKGQADGQSQSPEDNNEDSQTRSAAARPTKPETPDRSHRTSSVYIEEKMEIPAM